jgi:hypothetical protein
MGPLQASVPADTHKGKLILRLDRNRTDGHEEPAVSGHSLQAFRIGSFIGKCCWLLLLSHKVGEEVHVEMWQEKPTH